MRWFHRIADGRPERMAEILEEHGLTPDQWRTGLGEVTAVPGEPLPTWVQDAMALLQLVGSEAELPEPPRLREVAGDGLPAWVDPDQPWRFSAGFGDWLAAARRDVGCWSTAAPISTSAQHQLVLDLARRQLAVSGPLLMEAATGRGSDDLLFAADPRGDWEALWVGYPVVARLLATAWRQWREATAELCRRIAADLPILSPGVVVTAISVSDGDQHCGGRSVARLTLSDDSSIFLKPRSDGLHRLLAGVLAKVDAVGAPLGLRLPAVTGRDGYAWAREVRRGDCADDQAVDAYFRRAGALLRVAQALGATDLHHENFVPTPDLPVLVDLETVVAPGPLRTAAREDPVSARLADTPGPTSMVTSVVSGAPGRGTADIGALAGPGQALTPYAVRVLVQGEHGPTLRSNRVPLANGAALPRRWGRPVALRGHEQALIDGYAEAQARLELLAVTDHLPPSDPEPVVRFVARPTRTYARLLTQSTAPNALLDGVERELILERLYLATGTAPQGLIACEVEAMRDLDVPLFSVPFTGTDLVSDRGAILSDALTETPERRTRRRLRAVAGQSEHVDDLRATLFAMDPDERSDVGLDAQYAGHTGLDREPVALLLDRAIDVGDGTLAWIGLEHDPNRNRWTFGRMSAGLLGQAGIGLALAMAAGPTAGSSAVHTEPPAGCAAAARAALLGSVDRMGRGDQGPADAFSGPAGVLYAAAVAARLLGDVALLDAARSLVVSCLRAARRNEPSLVIDGTAGAILALLQLPEDAAVADALSELADLNDLADPNELAEVDELAELQQEDVDAPDCWSASLPSRAWGAGLARHRLARVRPSSKRLALPIPISPGDAIASATLAPPVWSGQDVPTTATLRTLLDQGVLAQAALRFGDDDRWAVRRDRIRATIAGRRAAGGRWSAPLLAPDSAWLSAVHGLPALAMLCADPGPDHPIARALT
jgi:hypothetical protein